MQEQLQKLFPDIDEILIKSLGVLWILAGILQLQPAMFTKTFLINVIEANLVSQPAFLLSLLHLGIHVYEMNMVLANLSASFIQLTIGALLLFPAWKRYRKFALSLSIGWGILVWIFGEGLGNLFTGSASFYIGAPGAVLLYVILALFLLFPQKLRTYFLPQVVGGIFFLGVILNELPMFWTKGMQEMFWEMSLQDQNGVVSVLARNIAHLATLTSLTNMCAIGVLLLLGTLLIVWPNKIVGYISIIFLFFVWWISQDFGGIFSFPIGTATDVNAAPLLMLFLVPIFSQSSEVMSHTLFFAKESGNAIEKAIYSKWFFASILIISGVLCGFVLKNIATPIHFSSSQNPMQMIMR
jgi:hypothetical protein